MNFDVVDLTQNIFDAMVSHLIGDSTFVLPDRRYIATGDFAYDCGEFVVHGVRIFAGFPGLQLPSRTLITTVWSLETGISVVRCTPTLTATGDPPDAPSLNTAGLQQLGDGGALLRAAMAARMDGSLLPSCSDVEIGPVTYGVPQGGLIGITLSLTAQIA